ncbi:MAG: hypothetical protein EXR03_05120 [Pseudolabrys sp.]|nr:hypothetical protein [Pseudolabrys sp.]
MPPIARHAGGDLAAALRRRRQDQIEAEDVGDELEELIWQVQHLGSRQPRIAYAFDGFGRALADWAN